MNKLNRDTLPFGEEPDVVEEKKTTDWATAVRSIVGFAAAIAPGSLILFMYQLELVQALSASTLLILSFALCMPVVSFNLFLCLRLKSSEKEKFIHGSFGFYFSALVLYLALGTAYVFSLSFNWFLICLLFFQVLFSLMSVLSANDLQK
jgi:hypothetical protein